MSDSVVDARAQLAQLDFRLGVGVGAVRERARLQAIIDGKPAAKKKRVAKQPESEPIVVKKIEPPQSDAELHSKISKALRARA